MRPVRFIVLSLLSLPVLAQAQKTDPVKWNFTSQKINETTYELHMTATIAATWHLYALETGDGPAYTAFRFTKNPLVTTTGKIKEVGKLHKIFDKNLNSELRYYQDQVAFVQTVTLKGKVTTNVKGLVEFTVCDDHQCLPPKEIEFSIGLGGK
jgi:thiol:disulfide interchange protein DsbD